jgi:hypothetical protein
MARSALEILFVGDAAKVPGAPPLRMRLMPGDAGSPSREAWAKAANRLEADERLLITFTLAPEGRWRRVAALLLVPLRAARLERTLTRSGCSVTRYAVGPSLDEPSVVFQVNTAAAQYASTHLVNSGRRLARVRAVLQWWLSCDPSMGGIVMVARR